jgi:hypothetical protein
MGLFSSGSKWKNAAREALKSAQAIESTQRDIEAQRSLLANIRQHRLASAQLDLMNYSDSYVSSSDAGASAMLDTGLADINRYSFETSQRMEEIQDYQEKYKTYMKKYAKQQKKRATAFSVAAIVGTALTGGALGVMGAAGTAAGSAGAASAAAGGSALAQFGAGAWTALGTYGSIAQGAAQIISNTGQTETGISNIISGIGQNMRLGKIESLLNANKTSYEVASVDPATGAVKDDTKAVLTYQDVIDIVLGRKTI